MNYCPYCGASTADGAASFCAECGKAFPSQKRERENRPVPQRKFESRRRPPPSTRRKLQKPWRKPNRSTKRTPAPTRKPKPNPQDEGYDGYYDDVQPADDGHVRERMDPELIKRAVMVAAGALGIIILSVIVMYVL